MGIFGTPDITGIDIGAAAVKAVRISGRGKRRKVVSAALIETQPGMDGTADALRLLKSGPVARGRHIMTILPGRDLTMRFLVLPKMPEQELNEAVRWEAKRHISYPLESALVEYLVTGERREGTVQKYEIFLVAAERGTVVERLAPFREAGISVSAVDASALALRNVLYLSERPRESNCLVVDMGAGKTEINIYKQGSLRFSRCIESGGTDMTRAVAAAAGSEFQAAEEAKQKINLLMPSGDPAGEAVRAKFDILLMEIRRSAEYYKATFREKGVERAILTGGVSMTQGIIEYFSGSLGIPVELDSPFAVLKVNRGVLGEYEAVAARFSVAVGLALRKNT